MSWNALLNLPTGRALSPKEVNPVIEAKEIAKTINEMGARLQGTLRFWGQWFSRPHDNCHHLVRCAVEDDVVCLTFNEGEPLRIWSPRRSAFECARHASGTGVFRITDAEQIEWE